MGIIYPMPQVNKSKLELRVIEELIKSSSSFSLKTEGNSMLPLLLPGDLVRYKKKTFSQVKVNDICLVKLNDIFATHRVIYKTGNFLITKGDNNITSDGKIYAKNLLAKAYSIKRKKQEILIDSIYSLKSAVYFKEIIKISRAFKEAKLSYLFLKGLPLYLYYTSSHPRRLYADCDVLVSKSQQEKAETILYNFGYRKVNVSINKIQEKLKNKEVEFTYYKQVGGIGVTFDLHIEVVFMMTQIGKLEALYKEEDITELTKLFLAKRRLVKIEKEKLPVLSASHLILYLCLHLFHHNFKGAYRYQFIFAVTKKHNNTIVESEIIDLCKKFKLQGFVFPSVSFLNKYFNNSLFKRLQQNLSANERIKKITIEKLKKTDVFSEDNRLSGGITRFKLLFLLSPEKLIKKLTVFITPSVLLAVFWSLFKKMMK
jgi:signal peptidase I